MPLKESQYDKVENRLNSILHKGFDYHGHIFERSMSNFLFREEKRAGVLAVMEEVIFELIERVKTIKTFMNYGMKKNYRDFN